MLTADETTFFVMKHHLATATQELFEAYGVPLVDCTRREDRATLSRFMLATTLGYAGERVRGAISIVTTSVAVEAWRVAAQEPEADLSDAIGEFANMLLGRLKSRLLGEGVVVLLSTPVTTSGSSLAIASPGAGTSSWLAFDGGAWRMDVRLDASFDEGFVLLPPGPEAAVTAGEMLMF